MKYLAIGSPRGLIIPADQLVNLYQTALSWADDQIKSGKIDTMYVFPEGGGMAIGNINSQEEAFDLLTSYPLYGLFDWKVEVLVDWKHAYTSIIERYKGMGAK
ncbi:MAG: hypothetical protein ACM3H7_04640 [Acidobacteriaceae bacterium]